MFLSHGTGFAIRGIVHGDEWTEEGRETGRADEVVFVVHHPSEIFEVFVREENVGALEAPSAESFDAYGPNVFVGITASNGIK